MNFEKINGQYQCPICKQLFSKYGINTHYRHKHSGEQQFIPGGWNKGLTAKEDFRVAKGKESLNQFYASKPKRTEKTCSKCKQTKKLEEFDKGRTTYCKVCSKEYHGNWYQQKENKQSIFLRNKQRRIKNQKFVFQYLLTHPCVDCGETNPMVLEFDHLHSKIKTITKLVIESYPLKTIITEIEKCVVRCVNCHRKKTAKEYNWFKYRLSINEQTKSENRRQKLQLKAFEYLKEHPCVDCGEINPIVLEFDHLRDKTTTISHLKANGYSWENILKEIEKCEVRCANCHRKKTAKEYNWYTFRFQQKDLQ